MTWRDGVPPWERPPEYFERGEDAPGELAAAAAHHNGTTIKPRSAGAKPQAHARNMPSSNYGVVPVNAFGFPDGEDAPPRSYSYWATAIDLLAQGIEPMPLYSIRRKMEQMTPARLGVFLISWTIYNRLPDWRIFRAIWRKIL